MVEFNLYAFACVIACKTADAGVNTDVGWKKRNSSTVAITIKSYGN